MLAPEFNESIAVAQLRSRPDLETGEALLRQSLIAGLGNVFKSEICFASRVNPFRLVGTLSITELASLMSNARRFMTNSVAHAERRTTGRSNPEERLWVYKRAGEACRQCGAAILSRKQGLDARITFWCPQCQPMWQTPPAS